MAVEGLADRIRASFNARDMDAFRDLIAEDATWGDDFSTERACPNRDRIIATYKRLLAEGVVGTVTETLTGPGGIACRIEVEWPDPATARGSAVFQVFRVRDGLVTRIEGREDRDSAVAAIAL